MALDLLDVLNQLSKDEMHYNMEKIAEQTQNHKLFPWKFMENQCTSKESIRFADDTQSENTTKMLTGFKWIQNDLDMWKMRECWMTSPNQNSAAQRPNEEQLARQEFSKGRI